MRDQLTRLPIHELISILYAIAARLALRGLLSIVDVTVIKELAGETLDDTDRAA